MQSKLENKGNNQVELEIEVEAEVFDEGLRRSFLKNSSKFNIPGFRKGKAPQNIVEKFYGEQALYEDAIEMIYPVAFSDAVKEHKLETVDKPQIDILEIGKGKNLKFTALVTIMPEVILGEYKGLSVKKAVAVVTEDELEAELKKLAENNSRLITIEDRPVQDGDTAVIDFEGFVDTVAFEGGTGTDYSLEIGSGTFIPGFEEQLIGAEIGSDIEVNVAFPEDYGSPDLAGKPAVFKVKVKEIKLKEMPVLDDEFAKDVSEFDTLESYKADLRSKLMAAAERKAEHENEDNVLKAVVENATVDIPAVMIDKQTDDQIMDFGMRLQYQGIELGQYMKMMGTDINGMRSQFRGRAEKEVKLQLVLRKISEVEKVTITEEDANQEFDRLAAAYKQDRSELIKSLKSEDISYIETGVLAKKTIELLIANTVFE